MFLRPAALMLSVMLTGGCLPVVETEAHRPIADGMPVQRPTEEERRDRCGAAGQQHLIGQTWPQELPRNMTRVRVIPQGLPPTADHDTDRVNVEIDPIDQRILRIWCG